MKRFTLIFLSIVFFWVVQAKDMYEVTATRLNVRISPSTTATVIGSVPRGELLEVTKITNDIWAEIEYHDRIGYVSTKFIKFIRHLDEPTAIIETPQPVVEEEPAVEEEVTENNLYQEPINIGELEVETPLTFGTSLSDNFNLYLAAQVGFGFSNFIWNGGDVNETMSYSLDVVAQLYFEKPTGFIPTNWYSEFAIGFDKRGAADFDMNYLHARIYPFGYRVPLFPMNIVIKAGGALGFPLDDLYSEYHSDFQFGVGGGLQLEWKQFAIGCNIEYDFTEVSSSCNQSLKNFAVLGTISYKFAKFGHKK